MHAITIHENEVINVKESRRGVWEVMKGRVGKKCNYTTIISKIIFNVLNLNFLFFK